MSDPPRRPRTLNDARTEAEAAFKRATAKVAVAPPKTNAVPGVKQQITLRIDQDVLEHFQAGGPGWQSAHSGRTRTAAGSGDHLWKTLCYPEKMLRRRLRIQLGNERVTARTARAAAWFARATPALPTASCRPCGAGSSI